MENYFEIGNIAGTQGIKGLVRVFPTTDDPSRFTLLKEFIIELHGKRTTFTIERVSFHKQFVLVKLSGIEDMTAAETLKGGRVLIPESEALPLGQDEYFMRDLYGLAVYTEEGCYLGEITDIFRTGANDVYEVTDNGQKEKKPILLPAIKQCILNIDLSEKKMTVHLLKGLVEE